MSSVNKVKISNTEYDISASPTGTLDSKSTDAYVSNDVATAYAPTTWTDQDAIAATDTNKTIFGKLTGMVKNIRHLYNKIGTASMTTTATTVTGAISELNSGKAASNHSHTVADLPVSSSQVNSTEYIPTSSLVYSMNTTLTSLNDAITDKLGKDDIIDNLTSTATDKALSANQGRVINKEFDKCVKLKGTTIRVLYNNSPIEFAAYSTKAANGTYFCSDDEGKVEILYPSSSSTDTDTINIYPVVGYTCDSTVTASMVTDNTVDLTASVKSFSGTITSSTTLYFTSNLYPNGIQIWGCGGGGGGGGADGRYNYSYYCPVAVGGAGAFTSLHSISSSNLPSLLSIQIGSGGTGSGKLASSCASKDGGSGGTTSVISLLSNETLMSAAGGSGGTASYVTGGLAGANGGSGSGASYTGEGSSSGDPCYIGASGYDGSAGSSASTYSGGTGQGTTTRSFGESSGTLYCSAGASCAYSGGYISTVGAGGGTGANGWYYNSSWGWDTNSANAGSGTTYGSGGGAAISVYVESGAYTATSGSGYQGVVMIRGIS